MRLACALIPRFALAVELLARPELRRRPVIVGGAPDERRAVVECSPEAEREGVRRGMPLREARARCREAVFLEAHPVLYRECYERMLNALETISPLVEESTPGCAYVGLDGLVTAHSGQTTDRDAGNGDHLLLLFPSEGAAAEAAAAVVGEALRLIPRLGIAESRFAAWAAALNAPEGSARLVPAGEAALFLAPLPVHYLPFPEEMVRRLHWLGLRRVEDLARLPRAALAAQFGQLGELAWEIAHGRDRDVLLPRRQQAEIEDRIGFDQPVADVQTVLLAAGYLLARLLNRSECRGRFVRGLLLSVTLVSGHHWERALTFREPTADQQRMQRALAAKLDGTIFPAAIEAVALVLRDLCGETGVQSSLFTTRGRKAQELQDALELLRSRLGEHFVMKIVGVEPWSRVPERQYALIDYDPSTSPAR